MLVQRRWRWANSETALGQILAFAGSAVDIVYGWKVKGGTIHLHLIINPKSPCSCSAISFFPNQDGVVCYFLKNKYSLIPEKNECREIT